jgi:hypothetical protein
MSLGGAGMASFYGGEQFRHGRVGARTKGTHGAADDKEMN